jgi:hypothetical protein
MERQWMDSGGEEDERSDLGGRFRDAALSLDEGDE